MIKLTKPIEKWKLSKNVMSTHVVVILNLSIFA